MKRLLSTGWVALLTVSYSSGFIFPCAKAFAVQGAGTVGISRRPAATVLLVAEEKKDTIDEKEDASSSLICPLLDPPVQHEATFEAAMG